MKVTFELDSNLLQESEMDSLSFYSGTMRQVIAREVKNQLVAEYMKKSIGFGDLGITKEDVKEAVVNLMAEKAMERKP